jgi:hypothetical protein
MLTAQRPALQYRLQAFRQTEWLKVSSWLSVKFPPWYEVALAREAEAIDPGQKLVQLLLQE